MKPGQIRVPLDIGAIHFIGVGGIGMSGIAEIMHNLGYKSPRRLGCRREHECQAASHDGYRDRGRSRGGKPQRRACRRLFLSGEAGATSNSRKRAGSTCRWCAARRCWPRSCGSNPAVAIAGTNGKTTTTTMVAALLDAALASIPPSSMAASSMPPMAPMHGLAQATGSWSRPSESDGTSPPAAVHRVAVVTNADPDHLDFYGTFDRMRDAFQRFIENVPFYGFAVLCIDHPEVQAMVGRITDRRIVTYGLSPQADVRALNVSFSEGASHFDVIAVDRRAGTETRIDRIRLPMPGEHNVQNALAAITVARQLGVPDIKIRNALDSFEGVKRRFSKVGEWNGTAIIDDYGHQSVQDRGRPQGLRAPGLQRPGDRGRPAASLHAPARHLGAVLRLLERCRCRNHRAGLSGRREAHRRHRPRQLCRSVARARPS